MYNRILSVLIALQCAALSVWAQQDLETVTKTTTRDVRLSSRDVLRVVTEKADVQIIAWNKPYVQVRMLFSAKHPDRSVAARELEFVHYALSREGNVVEFTNAFVLPANTDVIRSKLDVSVEFMVPAATPLVMKTRYGNVVIRGLTGTTDADLEFSDLDLGQMGGVLILKATFSEIRGEAIHVSSFKSEDSKSQFSLDVTGGVYAFQSRYSKLDLSVEDIRGLTIDGVRTDAVVRTKEPESYRYDLVNKSGKIYLPASYARYLQATEKQQTLQTPADAAGPLIKIHTTFDTITIK